MTKLYKPTDNLHNDDVEWVNELLDEVRSHLKSRAGEDPIRMHKLRRRIFTRLMHDERSTPAERKKLKARKMEQQKGLCAICGKPLPERGYYAVLDRKVAYLGYTDENVDLVHSKCDYIAQEEKGFK